ncbi:MAG: hypothetical protein ABI388_12680 [Bacteroidia bacterium]
MKKILLATFLVVFFFSCKKDAQVKTTTNHSAGKSIINGKAQKGPFSIGTSITVYELDSSYAQTGKSFFTQITDNSGSFKLNNAELSAEYVQLRADGFYYNEVCGNNSISQISLNCISHVSDATSLNINLLTHLECARVNYLLANGHSFDAAKNQAQQEILSIFNITLDSISHSEYLDISKAGDGNAILLAVSSILQGFRTEAQLTAILTQISSDIQTDGILNDNSIKSSLISHAALLDTVAIRNNLSGFYLNNSISATIPNFEKYIRQFITASNYTKISLMTFPSWGLYGQNLLPLSQITFPAGGYSFAGQIPKCSQLKIRMLLVSGSVWWSTPTNSHNVSLSTNPPNNNDEFFTIIDPSQDFDYQLSMFPGVILIEYYETNSNIPTYSKTITVN